MLVLTRKPHESLVISDNIVITVVEIQGERIRLGIEAPKDVAIYRGEVYERIQRELASSSASWEQAPNLSPVP